VDAPTGALTSLAKSRQKRPSILVVPINSFPPITPIQLVVDDIQDIRCVFYAPYLHSSRLASSPASQTFSFLELTPPAHIIWNVDLKNVAGFEVIAFHEMGIFTNPPKSIWSSLSPRPKQVLSKR
jgi:hypothetical protein